MANQGAGNSGHPPSGSRGFVIRLLVGVILVLLVLSIMLGVQLYSYSAGYAKLKNEYTRLEEEVTGFPPIVEPVLSANQIVTNLGINKSISWQKTWLNGSNAYGSINQMVLSSNSPNFPVIIIFTVYGFPSQIYARQNYYSSLLYVARHTQYNVSGTVSGWNYTYYDNGTQANLNYVFLAAYSGSLMVSIMFQNINPTAASQGINGKQLLGLLQSQIDILPQTISPVEELSG